MHAFCRSSFQTHGSESPQMSSKAGVVVTSSRQSQRRSSSASAAAAFAIGKHMWSLRREWCVLQMWNLELKQRLGRRRRGSRAKRKSSFLKMRSWSLYGRGRNRSSPARRRCVCSPCSDTGWPNIARTLTIRDSGTSPCPFWRTSSAPPPSCRQRTKQPHNSSG